MESLTPVAPLEKLVKEPLARFQGRIAHLVKSGINQRQAASSHVWLQRIRIIREDRMPSHGIQAPNCTCTSSNLFCYTDDPFTSSSSYPKNIWQEVLDKGRIEPSDLGLARPVLDGAKRAAGLIDSRAGKVKIPLPWPAGPGSPPLFAAPRPF